MRNGASRHRARPAALALAAGALCLLGPALASAQAAQPAAPPPPASGQKQADGRRTMALLPANLARGVVGVFAADNLRPFLIGAGATGASSLVDDRVRAGIGSSDSGFGKIGAAAGGALVMGSVVTGLFVAGRLSDSHRFRAVTYDLAIGMLAAEVYTALIKEAVDRRRPSGPTTRVGSSFPSGHTSTTFAMASVIEQYAGWRAGIPAYAFASIVGVSRVRYNRHYLSDVVAGATLGVIVGRTAVRMNGRPLPASRSSRRTRVSISPLGGVGLRAAIEF